MIFKLLLLFSLTSLVHAFDKDFDVVKDRVPLEFSQLFLSLKIQVKTPLEKVQLVGLCKELDENLGLLGKDHVYFLMKEEIIKNVLEYKHKKTRSFDVTNFLIDKLKKDFDAKTYYLTPFSRWIWLSIIAELEVRQKMGLISNRSFSLAQFDGAKKVEAQRFERYLKYIMPWIDKMDQLDVAQFNKQSKEVGWVILRRLNARSLLFKRFASTAVTNTKVTLFNIPGKLLEYNPNDLKQIQNDPTPLSLKEESEKEKTEAKKQTEKATPDDLSPLSDEVSGELAKELDQKSP